MSDATDQVQWIAGKMRATGCTFDEAFRSPEFLRFVEETAHALAAAEFDAYWKSVLAASEAEG